MADTGISISEVDLIDLVMSRMPMPSINRLQTHWVRYSSSQLAIQSPTWEKSHSIKCYNSLVQSLPHQQLLPADAVFHSQIPETVSVQLIQAPAEFTLPVKQDKRLAPSFKVRVKVGYRGQVSLPLTVNALLVTASEKDEIASFSLEGFSSDLDKRKITELKGLTRIQHTFEDLTLPTSEPSSLGGATMGLGPGFSPFEPEAGVKSLNGSGNNNAFWRNNEGDAGRLDIDMIQSSSADLGEMYSLLGLDPNLAVQHLAQQQQLQNQMAAAGALPSSVFPQLEQSTIDSQHWPATHSHPPPQQASMPSAPHATLPLRTIEQEFEFANVEFVRPTRMTKVFMVFTCSIMDVDNIFLTYNIPTIGICRAEQREKACNHLGVPLLPSVTSNNSDALPPLPMLSTVLNHSMSGIYGALETEGEPSGAPGSSGSRKKREALEDARGNSVGRHHQSSGMAGSTVPAKLKSLDPSLLDFMTVGGSEPSSGAGSKEGGDGSGTGGASGPAEQTSHGASPSLPYSREALRDWILEEYETMGFKRRLTQLDVTALLSTAGFPLTLSPQHNNARGGGGVTTISHQQWSEFLVQFRNVLALLRKINQIWNMEEPCVVSGFDMDRVGTITALANEPPGTFICRFSMSQPGCLVLTCKTAPELGGGDENHLLHAILRIDDLNERRVDTWIRDFAGATHVLDVYRNKRVDKRKVFASAYQSIRAMN